MEKIEKEKIKSLSDEILHSMTMDQAKLEQSATLVLLEFLQEVDDRKLYAKRGFSSLFDYCVQALHYSEMAASERVSAMRLVRQLPEAKERIENGELSLTTAASAQRFLYRAKKAGKFVDAKSLVDRVAGLSKREMERVFVSQLPEVLVMDQKIRPVTETHSELKFVVDDETLQMIQRFKELKGDVPLSEVMKICMEEYLSEHDPLRKVDLAKKRNEISEQKRLLSRESRSDDKNPTENRQSAVESRYIPQKIKQIVWTRSKGQCEYVDRVTGRRCYSKKRLEFDHIKPFMLGGSSQDPKNIRHLCHEHNIYEAHGAYGKDKISSYTDSVSDNKTG